MRLINDLNCLAKKNREAYLTTKGPHYKIVSVPTCINLRSISVRFEKVFTLVFRSTFISSGSVFENIPRACSVKSRWKMYMVQARLMWFKLDYKVNHWRNVNQMIFSFLTASYIVQYNHKLIWTFTSLSIRFNSQPFSREEWRLRFLFPHSFVFLLSFIFENKYNVVSPFAGQFLFEKRSTF